MIIIDTMVMRTRITSWIAMGSLPVCPNLAESQPRSRLDANSAMTPEVSLIFSPPFTSSACLKIKINVATAYCQAPSQPLNIP